VNLWKVSLISYHRQIYLGWGVDDAVSDLHTIWTPNTVWQQFINEVLNERATDMSKTC
jgi:hypothetical protein